MMRQGIRWLILTQYYAPEVGAAQTRLRALAKELRDQGMRVEVLTGMPNYPAGRTFPAYRGHLWKRDTIDGIPVRRTWLYARAGNSSITRIVNYLSFTSTALIAALFSRRPDVMFVESQPLTLGVVALAMKALRRVPYIYNVPDLQVPVARDLGFLRSSLLLKLAHNVETYLASKSWKVATVSHGFAEDFRRRGIPGTQLTFLPNGADPAFLRPRRACRQLLQRWELEGKKVFLFAGTHARYQGLETIIRAAHHLQHREDVMFLIAGDGPERANLETLAKELRLCNVVFCGSVPYEDLPRLYSLAYASLACIRKMKAASSMRPAKIFPSLSCGVPVVYAGTGEAAELLTSSRSGLVVEPEDDHAVANAVAVLAEAPSMRIEMGRLGRALVEQEFAWSTIVSRWLDELELEQIRFRHTVSDLTA